MTTLLPYTLGSPRPDRDEIVFRFERVLVRWYGDLRVQADRHRLAVELAGELDRGRGVSPAR